jgi:CheY-like chemotaxis protein
MRKPLALIVEDSIDLAICFARALQEAEYATEIIHWGDKALEWLSSMVPALVILDLHLPGASGVEILHYIRADYRLAQTRVIIASAYVDLAERLHGEADEILLKPVGFLQLRNLAAHWRPAEPQGFTVKTDLPGRELTEEWLTQLLFDEDWTMLFLRTERRHIATVVHLVSQAQVRFVGRWSETEFVLAADVHQAMHECERVERAGLSLSMGVVNGRTVGSFADAEDIINAARKCLRRYD